MSVYSYTSPTIFCAGTAKAIATYAEAPSFAPARIYPKGFEGKCASLILSHVSVSSVSETVHIALVPGNGTCESDKGNAKVSPDAKVNINLDIRDLHDIAGLLGYKLIPAV